VQRKTLPLVLLVTLFAHQLVGQPSRSDPVDVQARFGVQANLNLPKKWEGSLGYEGRMIGDASVYSGSYFDGELGRPYGKHLTFFGNYRYARITGAESHRLGTGFEWEKKADHFSVSFRPIFQYELKNVDDAEQGSKEALRTRLKVKVPATKRFTLYGSVEPYFAFTGIYPIDNWRNTVGVQWEFMKKRKVDLYYIYRPDYSKQLYNRTYHIFGAGVTTDVKFPR
jgi:hypothetical protein